MSEIRSRDHKSGGSGDGFRARCASLWEWIRTDVRSSARISVSFESSVALVILYTAVGFAIGGPLTAIA